MDPEGWGKHMYVLRTIFFVGLTAERTSLTSEVEIRLLSR